MKDEIQADESDEPFTRASNLPTQIRIEDDLGRTRDGGSCCVCGGDYQGAPYAENRGRRVLKETEPGVIEPANLCRSCFEEARK